MRMGWLFSWDFGCSEKDSPRAAQNLADADGVEDGGAGFPIGVFDFAKVVGWSCFLWHSAPGVAAGCWGPCKQGNPIFPFFPNS
jgi:hypothetical protein